jgi:hypothetical protein
LRLAPGSGFGSETEALIKEARRRHRRRQLITGLAAVAVLASGLGAFAGLRGSGQRAAASGRAGQPVTLPARTQLIAGTDAGLLPDSRGMARVFVLHLTGRHRPATAVPSSAAFLLSVTAWSPDGSWLFYQGPGQRMQAYQVRAGRVRSSRTPCCQYAVMGTVRSPPG